MKNSKMIYIKPDFYDDFKCIASDCKDSCCIGWEIDIDSESLEKYKSVGGSFGEKLKNSVTESEDGSKCFKLLPGDRCPFLNSAGLCDIYTECGEDYLCDICREHPRFYNCFPSVTECGLGLCCEEVCRLLLDNPPFSLVCETDDETVELTEEDDEIQSDYNGIFSFRKALFDCLNDKNSGYTEKVSMIKEMTEDFCGEKLRERTDKEIIEYYKKCEPINDEWTCFSEELSAVLPKILNEEKNFDESEKANTDYSKITAYMIYRHLPESVYDGKVADRVAFCLESARFVKLCDIKTFCEKGELTFPDRAENLKNWSKQTEYSSENLDILI